MDSVCVERWPRSGSGAGRDGFVYLARPEASGESGELPAFKGSAAIRLSSTYFVDATLVAAQLSIVVANFGARTWREADPLTLLAIGAVIGTGVAGGAIGWWLGHDRNPDAPLPASNPSVGLRETEKATWFSSVRNPILGFVGLLAAAAFLLLAARGGPVEARPIWLVVSLALFITFLLFESATVSVTQADVVVSLARWQWPRWTIPLNEITKVEAVRVRPMDVGGWGYRVCGRWCRAVVIRGGEALAIDSQPGRRLIVTVPDAQVGAGVINDLRNRAVSSS